MPDLKQPARAERVCRRCPLCGPSGECFDPALKSGRCGDWIWWVRAGKQIRRPYVKPHDPRTPAQLRSRARLSAASRKYSCSLTEKQRNACIAAGAKRRTRPRLYQSGPMTGQQYSISKEYALQRAHGDAVKTAIAPQVPQRQKLKVTSWDRPRSASSVPPERHQPAIGCARTRSRGPNKRAQPRIRQVPPLARRAAQAALCPQTCPSNPRRSAETFAKPNRSLPSQRALSSKALPANRSTQRGPRVRKPSPS